MISKSVLRKIPSNFERTFISNSTAALARSHRLIRIEQGKEMVFICLCSQIHLDDFRKNRSENQREDRRQKREKTKMTKYSN
jgi:hypothetical protein